MIDLARDIHPLSDFKRKTTEFVQRLRETRRPVLLTLNGRPEVVVLDACSYQELIHRLRNYETRLAASTGDERQPGAVTDGIRPGSA
jgi:prevent-host-death family protein